MKLPNPLLNRLGGRPLALAPRVLDGLLAVGLSLEARRAMVSVREGMPAAVRGYITADSGIAVRPVLGTAGRNAPPYTARAEEGAPRPTSSLQEWERVGSANARSDCPAKP